MRRVAVLLACTITLSLGSAVAGAHNGAHPNGPCVNGTGHGSDDTRADNPVTGGRVTLADGTEYYGIYVDEAPGHVSVDNRGPRFMSADGNTQARFGSGGPYGGTGNLCVFVNGQTIKV